MYPPIAEVILRGRRVSIVRLQDGQYGLTRTPDALGFDPLPGTRADALYLNLLPAFRREEAKCRTAI